jgi:DNA processing protein
MSKVACAECLARAGLLARLAGSLDHVGADLSDVLALDDADLIAAIGGRERDVITRDHAAFSAERARAHAVGVGLTLICRCHPAYPQVLRELTAPPAVLHITGRHKVVLEPERDVSAAGMPSRARGGDPAGVPTREPGGEPAQAVAVVGARAASPYGIEVARGLGRGLAAAGLTVVSGMARGIDSAAHWGALEVGGTTIAVLAGGAERPYPASARGLHARIRNRGAVVSELPPGTGNRRWMFPARNRLIAGLAVLTVVVEAGPGSGALLTAAVARELGRPVAAVPGRVTSPLAVGPHELIGSGAALVTGADDVLESLALAPEVVASTSAVPGMRAAPEPAAGLPGAQRTLLDALAEGQPTETALTRAGLGTDAGLAALAALELAGLIAREPGGRWTIRAW